MFLFFFFFTCLCFFDDQAFFSSPFFLFVSLFFSQWPLLLLLLSRSVFIFLVTMTHSRSASCLPSHENHDSLLNSRPNSSTKKKILKASTATTTATLRRSVAPSPSRPAVAAAAVRPSIKPASVSSRASSSVRVSAVKEVRNCCFFLKGRKEHLAASVFLFFRRFDAFDAADDEKKNSFSISLRNPKTKTPIILFFAALR